ncbi:myb/SANT-like DNA-binding domain-containing protein 1 [Dermacentor silvarum]|uniref:myb/SANT-like DNA-binding domain-containing protein 1 n=1 Tax=Dermacentor silvarum TaxID=543639 RepID=UPI002101AF5A|nr:myb/SANT-like DNA-binding domain-containing protein 1 [Dermacentor silvarum]
MTSTQPEASKRKERARWTEAETFTLIRIWEDNIGDLRRAKRNAKVYAAIFEKLRAAGIEKTLKDIKSKIENLADKYREINKNKRTGSGCIRWPFYWELHKFLETLPINDATLVCESACSDDATVEQIIRQMEVGDPAADDQPEPPPDMDDMFDVPPSPCAEENTLPAATAHSNEAEVQNVQGQLAGLKKKTPFTFDGFYGVSE